MLVYSPPEATDVDNIWTKEALIAVREFEKDVKVEEDYKLTCLAEQVSISKDDVVCTTFGF